MRAGVRTKLQFAGSIGARRLLFLLLSLFSLPALSARAADDTAPGLVGEYFQFNQGVGNFPKIPADKKPTLVRVDKQVDFGNVTGDFYGARMISNFYARWHGTLHAEKAGKYEFFTSSDDGSRLFIDGKLIVDNGGIHPSQEKSGSAELSAGAHEIKIEFFQGGGEAEVSVEWQPPGGKREAIPEKALSHKKSAENIPWDKAAWESKPKVAANATGNKPAAKGGKIDKMDYGPFLTGSIEGGFPEKGNFANKGMAIKLTKETSLVPPAEGQPAGKMAAICYDTDLLRAAYGWSGGYLRMPTGRDGLEGHPIVEGTVAFGSKKASLGWAKGDDFKDPRPKGAGPLPHDWARYKGVYIHGEKTVLSYTVGDCAVLEMPAFESKDGLDVFSRNFFAGKSTAPMTLLVCEQDKGTGAVVSAGQTGGTEKSGIAGATLAVLDQNENCTAAGLAGAPAGASWNIDGGRILLKLPPLAAPAKFAVCIYNGPKSGLPKFAGYIKTVKPADLEALTKGGPARWPEAITLKGELGQDNIAYTVDTAPVPYENAWNSYMRLTGIDFFPDGRAAVCTMSGDVWLVSGLDATLEKVTWKRFASGSFQPLGLKVVDGKVYTLNRDQITRFHDFNNDGEADFYEAFNNDAMIGNNYHEFAHDLHTDTDGNFYYVRGSNLGSGGTPHNGCIIKVSKDGAKSEVVAIGFRAPNGMCVGPNNQITTGDNQGNWIPASPVNWIYPPDAIPQTRLWAMRARPWLTTPELTFCGFRLDAYPFTKKGPRINPVCWIPYGADNSCGGQVWATGDKWGPFKDHLLHMSYGKCSLFHVMTQKVAGEMQGGVTRFPLNFASGVMRARFNSVDGQLYLVGMKGWQNSATKAGNLQRVRYTGKPVHMPLEYKITKTGMEIAFTEKLDPEFSGDAQNWGAQWFHVAYTGDYGSPEFSVSDRKKKGREEVPIASVKVAPDGKTVVLEIPGLKPVTNLIVKYKVKFADGETVQQELDATINRMP